MVDSLCTQNDSLLTYSLKGLVLSGLLLPRFVVSPGNNFNDAWKDPFLVVQYSQVIMFSSPTFSGGISHFFQSTRFRGKNKPTQAFLLLKANPFPFKKISCFPKILCFETVYRETVLTFLKINLNLSLYGIFQARVLEWVAVAFSE